MVLQPLYEYSKSKSRKADTGLVFEMVLSTIAGINSLLSLSALLFTFILCGWICKKQFMIYAQRHTQFFNVKNLYGITNDLQITCQVQLLYVYSTLSYNHDINTSCKLISNITMVSSPQSNLSNNRIMIKIIFFSEVQTLVKM